jgi:hypothetical protein
MPEPLSVADLAGERLPLPEYRAEFATRQWEISGQESWKLERGQHFREPGFASWEAFARGDWEQALALIEEERDFLTEFSAGARAADIGLYRVRVVEEPIASYLQWELHLLNLRAACGELIHIVAPDLLRDYEAGGPLAELVTLGPSLLYRVLYDTSGELAGAVRITEPRTVARAVDLARSLYSEGEDLAAFFDRVVAPMPPPGERVFGT